MSFLSKLFFTLSILLSIHPVIWAQGGQPADFESNYNKADQLLLQTVDSLEELLALMKQSKELSDSEEARLNLIRSKMKLLEDILDISLMKEIVMSDTSGPADPLLKKARAYIVQSRPDDGIPLIMKYLENADKDSDSAVYAKIYLAEAYRQKQEYTKGINMIYELLGIDEISYTNRAFALNRMAALMSEKKPFDGHRSDSVIKYSRLCIELAQKHQLTEHLALSQNELGNNYMRINMPDSALFMISEAAGNFKSMRMVPQTINTYLNLSRIYASSGQLEQSKEILQDALELGNIEENRNLFMYVYFNLADIYYKSGEYESAYHSLKVAYSLLNQFFNDRIQRQINEMSAKYGLHEKEMKLQEEEQKSRTYRLRVNFILIISFISISLLIVLVISFRFKNRAYKKLVEHNLKTLKLEKQVESWLRNLSENDIRKKISMNDRNEELALRLEKYLAEEKPYLYCDVSLEEFCKKLNTNRTYLSKLINDRYNMSFYDLLFEYRIRAAVEFLNNPQYNYLSLEGIGEMAGFKSNSNFYKRFKSMVGMTPQQFREKSRKF